MVAARPNAARDLRMSRFMVLPSLSVVGRHILVGRVALGHEVKPALAAPRSRNAGPIHARRDLPGNNFPRLSSDCRGGVRIRTQGVRRRALRVEEEPHERVRWWAATSGPRL